MLLKRRRFLLYRCTVGDVQWIWRHLCILIDWMGCLLHACWRCLCSACCTRAGCCWASLFKCSTPLQPGINRRLKISMNDSNENSPVFWLWNPGNGSHVVRILARSGKVRKSRWSARRNFSVREFCGCACVIVSPRLAFYYFAFNDVRYDKRPTVRWRWHARYARYARYARCKR